MTRERLDQLKNSTCGPLEIQELIAALEELLAPIQLESLNNVIKK